jgi:hypothetical protein
MTAVATLGIYSELPFPRPEEIDTDKTTTFVIGLGLFQRSLHCN